MTDLFIFIWLIGWLITWGIYYPYNDGILVRVGSLILFALLWPFFFGISLNLFR